MGWGRSWPAPAVGREVPGKKKQSLTQDAAEETPEFSDSQAAPQNVSDNRDSYWWEGGQKVRPGEEFDTRKLVTPLDRMTRRQTGKRSRSRTERKRGRYVQARPARERNPDLAFDATVRAAAPFQLERAEERKQVAVSIHRSDLQQKVRVRKSANLILFVVDASWSMAVAERMSATKGAILSLLTDAYQRRDRVGLIVFQKNQAVVVLTPTNSVQLAKQALVDIPVGGKTPLSAGLTLALKTFEQEKNLHSDLMPLMILLTDGAANVSMSDLPPQEEAHRVAEQIKEAGVKGVVVNMEHAAFDQGLAQKLADRLGCPCYTLRELKAESLYQAVKGELGTG